MPIPTFHCLECDKNFKPGEYECTPGQKHVVKAKRYYMDDAPTVPEWRDGRPFINKGASRTVVLNIPPEQVRKEGEEIVRVPGGSVEFVRGMFETTDPEHQFYLDRKAGLCSEERWKEVYLNDDEKMQIEKMQLAAERTRLENERNELLAHVKASQRKEPKARAAR